MVWWRLANPRTLDCRVVALDGENRVLLVRHSYGTGEWMLPGGRPNRGEHPVAAGLRELAEEVGCGLEHPIEVMRPDPAAHHVRHVVVGRTGDTPRIDGREIVEARFCDPEALPGPVGEHLAGRLGFWIERYRDLV